MVIWVAIGGLLLVLATGVVVLALCRAAAQEPPAPPMPGQESEARPDERVQHHQM
jgi:hypothetical protein